MTTPRAGVAGSLLARNGRLHGSTIAVAWLGHVVISGTETGDVKDEQWYRTASASARNSVLLLGGFRLFFLAACCLPVWRFPPGSAFPPARAMQRCSTARDWYVHEMLFWFSPAVIAGFLPHSCAELDRPACRQGPELMLPFGVWGIGRCGHGSSDRLPLLAALLDGAFLVCLARVVWRELAAGKS